jgi:hypothetical protein
MSKENTYHFNLVLIIISILQANSDLTIDEIFREVCRRENLVELSDFEQKNLRERIHKRLAYLEKHNRVILTKQLTRIKTVFYTASLNKIENVNT